MIIQSKIASREQQCAEYKLETEDCFINHIEQHYSYQYYQNRKFNLKIILKRTQWKFQGTLPPLPEK